MYPIYWYLLMAFKWIKKLQISAWIVQALLRDVRIQQKHIFSVFYPNILYPLFFFIKFILSILNKTSDKVTDIVRSKMSLHFGYPYSKWQNQDWANFLARSANSIYFAKNFPKSHGIKELLVRRGGHIRNFSMYGCVTDYVLSVGNSRMSWVFMENFGNLNS